MTICPHIPYFVSSSFSLPHKNSSSSTCMQLQGIVRSTSQNVFTRVNTHTSATTRKEGKTDVQTACSARCVTFSSRRPHFPLETKDEKTAAYLRPLSDGFFVLFVLICASPSIYMREKEKGPRQWPGPSQHGQRQQSSCPRKPGQRAYSA